MQLRVGIHKISRIVSDHRRRHILTHVFQCTRFRAQAAMRYSNLTWAKHFRVKICIIKIMISLQYGQFHHKLYTADFYPGTIKTTTVPDSTTLNASCIHRKAFPYTFSAFFIRIYVYNNINLQMIIIIIIIIKDATHTTYINCDNYQFSGHFPGGNSRTIDVRNIIYIYTTLSYKFM